MGFIQIFQVEPFYRLYLVPLYSQDKQILAEEIEPTIEFLEDIEQCLWRAISVAS